MIDLIGLPNGRIVFVDTMIFLLHFRGKSATCSALIQRIARGEIKAYVDAQVLSDLIHKLMLAEAFTKGLIRELRASELKRALLSDRSITTNLNEYQEKFESVLNLGITVVPLGKKLLIESINERRDFGLMTGDSIHLCCMKKHKNPIRDIVTHDGDFLHIPDITVWTPMDVV